MHGRRAQNRQHGGRHRHEAAPGKRHWVRLRQSLWATASVVVLAIIGIAALTTDVLKEQRAARLGVPVTEPTHVSAAPPPVAPVPQPSSTGPLGTLNADFAQLQRKVHGVVAIAVTAVGVGQSPRVLGDSSSGPAWSTIKVPLAIAALREPSLPDVTQAINAAITESDNAAAESLWEGLGDPNVAAKKIENVLREAGDQTLVQMNRVRPPFTAFGQTIWSLSDQAKFISYAVCDSRDKSIFDLMGQIDRDQSWGLGSIAAARFKGGWGPKPTGDYFVRQMGVIPTPGGMTAVSISVEPASGSFDDGTEELTEVANWLSDHRGELPSGRCDS
jgi:hypothetical protein